MCSTKEYGFLAALVQNRVSIFAINYMSYMSYHNSEYWMQKSTSLYLHSSPVIDDILSGVSLLSLPVQSVLQSVVLLKLFSFGNDLLTLSIHRLHHDQIFLSMGTMPRVVKDTERVSPLHSGHAQT